MSLPDAPQPHAPRLLYIEDEPVNRMVVSRYLAREGYVVECAEDGMQGLALLAANTYDLLLLDMGLPGMSGAQVARHLRDSTDWVTPADIPVLVLTAFGPDDVRRIRAEALPEAFPEALPEDSTTQATDRALFSGVAEKPLDLPALVQRIEALLHAGHAGHNAASPPNGEAAE